MTMKVRFLGALVYERSRAVSMNAWAEMATVMVREGVACIEDLTDGDSANQCP